MRYITRVELHAANEADYEQLHAAMEAKGFLRTIQGADGRVYRLPSATYFVDTAADQATVRAAAIDAAGSTNRRFGVIVTAGTSMWQGLASV